jgi:hypothetical protein
VTWGVYLNQTEYGVNVVWGVYLNQTEYGVNVAWGVYLNQYYSFTVSLQFKDTVKFSCQ